MRLTSALVSPLEATFSSSASSSSSLSSSSPSSSSSSSSSSSLSSSASSSTEAFFLSALPAPSELSWACFGALPRSGFSSLCRLVYSSDCTAQSTATPRPQILLPFSSSTAFCATAGSANWTKAKPRFMLPLLPSFVGTLTSVKTPSVWKAFRTCFSPALKERFRTMRRPALPLVLLSSRARKVAEMGWPFSSAPSKASTALRAFISFRKWTTNVSAFSFPSSALPMLRCTRSMPQPPGSFSSIQACTASFFVPCGTPTNCTLLMSSGLKPSDRPALPPELELAAAGVDPAVCGGAVTAGPALWRLGFAACRRRELPWKSTPWRSSRQRRASVASLNLTRP
mmetsp:Transcript_93022/g.272245  ORF Transcript_93022/g.272245 Transcript_93022/m.272245 type:complete len:341 (-) Transcript_93022:88-1110(-)